MRSLFSSTRRARASVVALALFTVASANAQQNCTALVRFQNDLWLVSASGQPKARLTYDGRTKYAAALSPDGSVIAFSGKPSPYDVSIIDSTGRAVSDVDLHVADAIIDLQWMSPSLLRAAEHISPADSRFHFLVGAGRPLISVATVPTTRAEGVSCGLSPHQDELACADSDGVTLRGKTIYQVPGPFDNSNELQTIQLAMGASATTDVPQLRVEFEKLSGDVPQLRVTNPDGQWQEMFLSKGRVFSISLPNDNLSSAATQYGIGVRTVDRAGRLATVSIKRSNTGAYSFEAGPIWDPRGKRIAFIEKNEAGGRWLVVVNRQLGAADSNNGGLDGRFRLPANEPATSMLFVSETQLRVVGATTTADLQLPAQGKIPANTSFVLTKSMPVELPVTIGAQTVLSPVDGWACR